MRYAYDTEFLEDGRTIELISIGIVAEDGRELYLVNRDAPWRRIRKDEWLMANVVPKLPQPHGDWINHMPKRWVCDLQSPHVRDRAQIRDAVQHFLLGNPATGEPVELWADYAAYDHVVLAQLWGKMIHLPDGVPMFTHDLQQEISRQGNPPVPQQESGQHSAIEDARHLMVSMRALGLVTA